MGILIDETTHVLVQGITGFQGSLHTKSMISYGTKIKAGVRPGKGGLQIHGIPVFNSVKEAKEQYSIDSSILFIPAPFVKEAVFETIDSRIKTIVIITEDIPIKDAILIIKKAEQNCITIIGPNSPGIISPGDCKLGIMPSHVFYPGNVGLVSRSGTLTYEIAASLTREKIGQSTCIGIGGDPITGISFIDCLKLFEEDPETKAVVLIGEIGGNAEEKTAEYILSKGFSKPIIAYIAGRTAPLNKRMGHAGAIIMGQSGSAKSKIEALNNAGVNVAEKPSDIPKMLKPLLKV